MKQIDWHCFLPKDPGFIWHTRNSNTCQVQHFQLVLECKYCALKIGYTQIHMEREPGRMMAQKNRLKVLHFAASDDWFNITYFDYFAQKYWKDFQRGLKKSSQKPLYSTCWHPHHDSQYNFMQQWDYLCQSLQGCPLIK